MNIYYDENMPWVTQFFSGFGTLTPFSGRDVTTDKIRDAHVLLTRSITQVNADLLDGCSQLEFVGTATIGFDHIDRQYLQQRNIAFTNSPGCNANSVAEYVVSALFVLQQKYDVDLRELCVGIVGAGNTGSALQTKLDALGIRYLLCDPPKQQAGDPRSFVDYQTLLSQSDIVSFHVPKVKEGVHRTIDLFGDDHMAAAKPGQMFINACRGEVIDNNAMLKAKQKGWKNPVVLDVWANEPHIEQALIPYVDIATPHIAGHSIDGKARGTEMLYAELCKRKQLPISYSYKEFLPESIFTSISVSTDLQWHDLGRLIHLVYDVRRDDAIFRNRLSKNGFDGLRKHYPVRYEFSALQVTSAKQSDQTILSNLGFG